MLKLTWTRKYFILDGLIVWTSKPSVNPWLKNDFSMINKLAQNPTQQRIDTFLNETNHGRVIILQSILTILLDYMSPPMSHRSYVSVSGLETREWKMME